MNNRFGIEKIFDGDMCNYPSHIHLSSLVRLCSAYSVHTTDPGRVCCNTIKSSVTGAVRDQLNAIVNDTQSQRCAERERGPYRRDGADNQRQPGRGAAEQTIWNEHPEYRIFGLDTDLSYLHIPKQFDAAHRRYTTFQVRADIAVSSSGESTLTPSQLARWGAVLQRRCRMVRQKSSNRFLLPYPRGRGEAAWLRDSVIYRAPICRAGSSLLSQFASSAW